MDFIQKYDKPALLVLVDFHVYFDSRRPDAKVIRKVRDTVNLLKGGLVPKNVLLISPRLVLPNELQKDITIVDFDLPDYRDIEQILRRIVNDNRGNTKIRFDLDRNASEELARAAQGLTLQEAENAFARAIVERGCLDKDSRDIIVEEKQQIIKKTGVLEYIQSDLDLDDVGGLGNLKKWLLKRNNSWQGKAAKYSLPAPKGVLITGVPGCDKSLTAKAISAMWKLPLLRMDVGKIFSGIVGSSEENMRNTIKTAEAAAPSILWIDEIEKGFSGVSGGGDSGTSTRVFGTFLTWMQEKKNPVFVVATANNIHALPSEMMRKGRFDEIFFVDLPTASEREAIFKVHLMRRLKDLPRSRGPSSGRKRTSPIWLHPRRDSLEPKSRMLEMESGVFSCSRDSLLDDFPCVRCKETAIGFPFHFQEPTVGYAEGKLIPADYLPRRRIGHADVTGFVLCFLGEQGIEDGLPAPGSETHCHIILGWLVVIRQSDQSRQLIGIHQKNDAFGQFPR